MLTTVKNLSDLKKVFRQVRRPLVGVGVNAFNRLGLEDLTSDYRVVCLRYNLETPAIEQAVKVYCLERGRPARHLKCRRNSTAVLLNKRTQKYLKKILPEPALLFYKPTYKIERVCKENGWLMLANPPKYGKKTIENKVVFRDILKKCGIDQIPGETNNVANLNFEDLNEKYGPRFVAQLPDRGGGKGTFFINSRADFENFINHHRVLKYKIPPDVVITKLISGPSPSLTACVTREGILSTNLQYQLLDIPELWNLKKGSGLFSGHDWAQARFSDKVNQQANQIAQKIGEHFAALGYKGIFGLDMLLDKETEKLYVVECNPRLLGSFPCLPMVQVVNGEPSILGFHVLEFLGHNYRIDVNQVNEQMRRQKPGSQMICHNLLYHWAHNERELAAGVYCFFDGKFAYQRPGYHYKHLQNNDEFLITDGVPVRNSKLTPNQRLLRILSLRGVIDLKNYKLNQWGHDVATWVYNQLAITPNKEQPEGFDEDDD